MVMKKWEPGGIPCPALNLRNRVSLISFTTPKSRLIDMTVGTT